MEKTYTREEVIELVWAMMQYKTDEMITVMEKHTITKGDIEDLLDAVEDPYTKE